MANHSPKSNELLAQDIQYIKDDIADIKQKLDNKYVSHETFDLTIKGLREADTKIINTAMFLATPVYAGVIALLIKIFTN